MTTKKTGPFLLFIKSYGLDLLLGVLAAGCFTFFAKNSLWNIDAGSSHGPIARFTAGQLERKSQGSVDFTDLNVGQDLINMDTLWVGKGRTAKVEILSPRWEFDIPERTLLMLKQTFKDKRIIILAERKKLDEMKIPKQGLIEELNGDLGLKQGAIPALAPKEKIVVKAGVYPADGLTLYRRPEDQSDFSFNWPEAADGFLQIRRQSDRKVLYFPIQKQNTIHVALSPEDTYFWQVIGADRNVISGPYSFSAKILTEEAKKNLLNLGTAEGKVEVHW